MYKYHRNIEYIMICKCLNCSTLCVTIYFHIIGDIIVSKDSGQFVNVSLESEIEGAIEYYLFIPYFLLEDKLETMSN